MQTVNIVLQLPIRRRPAHFLTIPRELRDAIYEEYVRREGGYVYDFRTGKLHTADGDEPISQSFAFVFTGKQVTSEMKCIHLKVNQITFMTFWDEEIQCRAVRYEKIFRAMTKRVQAWIVSSTRPCITDDVYSNIVSRYPGFRDTMDVLQKP